MELKIDGLNEEQIADLEKQIAEFRTQNEKPKDVIDYEDGYVIANGEIDKTDIVSKYEVDCLYSIGLYCGTEKEAEKLLRKMQIEHRLRQWAKMCKEKVDWNNDMQWKFFIQYEIGKKVCIYGQKYFDYSAITFTDESILQRAIEDIGEQNLIDNYFVEV